MKKKIICAIILVVIASGIISVSAILQPVPDQQEFSREKDRIRYNFAAAYSAAAIEMRNMYLENMYAHLAACDLEPDIQKMHEIMDEYLLLIKKWEEESDTICVEPYSEIRNMIEFEHAYYLSKTEMDRDGEKWKIFRSLYVSIRQAAEHYVNTCDILGKELENPSLLWTVAQDASLTDYLGAYHSWKHLRKYARAYLDDTDIPDEKKEWVSEYMQRGSYVDLSKRLKEKGVQGVPYFDQEPL